MSRKFVFCSFVLLVSCVVGVSQQDSNTSSADDTNSVAALVNGEVITRDHVGAAAGLNKIFQVILSQLPNFGQVLLSTPEGNALLDAYQLQVLEQLIDRRLLVQQAIEQEIAVEEAAVSQQVEGQLQQIMEQNTLTIEQIADLLKQQGSSLDEYMEQLGKSFREQLLIQGLHEKITAQATGSDEEIAAYYDAHKEDFATEDGAVPPLSEVRDQIRETLLPQIQTAAWQEWFENEKKEAQIEILF